MFLRFFLHFLFATLSSDDGQVAVIRVTDMTLSYYSFVAYAKCGRKVQVVFLNHSLTIISVANFFNVNINFEKETL